MKRNNDYDNDDVLYTTKPGNMSFFKGMPRDLVVEFIINNDLNMLQIVNFCKALQSEFPNICEDERIWDKLFQKRFGRDAFNQVMTTERLANPMYRFAAYTLSVMPEIRQAAGIRFMNEEKNTQMSVRIEQDGNVDVREAPIDANDAGWYWYDHEAELIFGKVADLYGLTKLIDGPWDNHDIIFIYEDSSDPDGVGIYTMLLQTDVYARALMYILLSEGWVPHRSRNDPMWVHACIGCKSEKTRFECAGCLKVEYCGVDCAKQHWEKHKPICERISRRKARQILHDGRIKEHPLTEKQRRYFGYLSNH